MSACSKESYVTCFILKQTPQTRQFVQEIRATMKSKCLNWKYIQDSTLWPLMEGFHFQSDISPSLNKMSNILHYIECTVAGNDLFVFDKFNLMLILSTSVFERIISVNSVLFIKCWRLITGYFSKELAIVLITLCSNFDQKGCGTNTSCPSSITITQNLFIRYGRDKLRLRLLAFMTEKVLNVVEKINQNQINVWI